MAATAAAPIDEGGKKKTPHRWQVVFMMAISFILCNMDKVSSSFLRLSVSVYLKVGFVEPNDKCIVEKTFRTVASRMFKRAQSRF